MTYGKLDSRMLLRGKLDSLNAQIILIQTSSKNQEFISDLEEVRGIVRKLQRCEACEEVFEGKMILLGIEEDEIHERSHNPLKFYGHGHIMPHYEMKHESAVINFLRTFVRETELISVRAFDSKDPYRINHILNRLSSALYILVYKYLPQNYEREINFHSSSDGRMVSNSLS